MLLCLKWTDSAGHRRGERQHQQRGRETNQCVLGREQSVKRQLPRGHNTKRRNGSQ